MGHPNPGSRKQKTEIRRALADCVEVHVNDDARSGREKGLVCSVDHDGIVGIHPADGAGRKVAG